MSPDGEFFEERAAIREFDGGMSREESERLAREDLENHRHRCEVIATVARYWPDAGRMKAYLATVMSHRGKAATERLRADCLEEWKRRGK